MHAHLFLQIGFRQAMTGILFILLIALPLMYILILLLTRKRWLNKKKIFMLQMTHDNEMLQARLETQEQVFRNISADIHDNIGQRLSLAHFYAAQLAEQGTDAGHIADILRTAIADLRDLSHSLSAEDIAEEGLHAVIKKEIALLNKGNRLRADFYEIGGHAELDNDTATILYRVFQEGIQNVLRHAKATHVKIFLGVETDTLEMHITDNGTGTDGGFAEGNGLRNIRSRLKLIRGSLAVENSKEGTTLHIVIPKMIEN